MCNQPWPLCRRREQVSCLLPSVSSRGRTEAVPLRTRRLPRLQSEQGLALPRARGADQLLL